MLLSSEHLSRFRIHATDGDLGQAKDLFFDDLHWAVRYIVIDTGVWLANRLVLVSPVSVGCPDFNGHRLPVNLSKDQITHSPEMEEHRPPSLKHDTDLCRYYGWPEWWTVGSVIAESLQEATPATAKKTEFGSLSHDDESVHLRSAIETHNYDVAGEDGRVGHVADFIVDTDYWRMRYVVVDTTDYLPGGKVLIACEWIEDIDWANRCVHFRLAKDKIKSAPHFDAREPVNRKYEEQLFDYYGRVVYWTESR